MAENKSVRPYEEFAAHIQEETTKAREQLITWIDNPNITSVGCVDRLTEKGSVNPPGGLIFLYTDQDAVGGGSYSGLDDLNENLLERWVSVRAEVGVADGILWAHKNCGYIRVVLGADDLGSQVGVIRSAQNFLNKLNGKYHTRFKVGIENQGSATPYMKKG
ncbi:MAG: hypothetical protein US40_C0009G0041 [Candidatus Roizmanbacteria bacterium GW2011_GWC2_37_13]|uniref:Uncharacterized protein n=1 Tax=Candidatus Roizmanbacteria bacterium GW2011_GWC2_37_13 TaxID=1618486 RepID=A0A0G0GGX9_9BACT|nr:MAG: hypothetical protein US38_C0009G0044 [Candidatus Roizmanbacteria bacterium GW2011_GWC1_37_12]KKQ25335.1 MAG: hypothetical protein US40_C0009G0041 [Candidatus Roizmanbacteria bacterium GW2011_GWC2_37_13]